MSAAAAFLAITLLASPQARGARSGETGPGFAVKFKDEVTPYRVMGLFVMPGDTVPLEALLTDTLSRYTAEAGAGRLERTGPASWRWVAPREKGVSAIVVRDSASGETVALHAFVMVPRPAGRRSTATGSAGTSRASYGKAGTAGVAAFRVLSARAVRQ